MSRFNIGWYLIYTMPRHERKVHSRLTELEITSFLPTRKVLRTWHDRKKYVDEPLFPSYIFVYLNDMQNYYDGLDIEGSLYYVKTGKEIARVQDNVVDSIRLAVAHANNIEVSDTYFKPGKKVIISEGPLAGLSCEVIHWYNKQKLLVRVELLQRSLLLTIPEEKLLPEETVGLK